MRYLTFITGLLLAFSAYPQSGSFTFDGNSRTYLVHLPADYNPLLQYPLMLNLHGWGSNGLQQQYYTQMDDVADTAGFIVVYPDAVDNTWNAGLTAGAVSSEDDVGFLSALIDTLAEKYSVDTCHVFSAGMSLGGFMSYRLACELSYKIKAVASVTGLMADNIYNNCNGGNVVPVLQIHGTNDSTVDYNGEPGYYSSVDSTMALWVNNNSSNSSPVVTNLPDVDPNDGSTVTTYHYKAGTNDAEVLLYQVIDGEHTWPGAPSANTNQDIKASGEIWNFFRKYLCEETGTVYNIENKDPARKLSIFPNPSDGIVKFRFPDRTKQRTKQLLIYDLQGRELFSYENNQKSENEIDMTHFKPGIFFVKIITDKNVQVRKLILR